MKENEVRKTTVLSFDIDEASAKTRNGMPNDEEEDKPLPIWSGIIPIETSRRDPVPDELSRDIPLPKHLMPKSWTLNAERLTPNTKPGIVFLVVCSL